MKKTKKIKKSNGDKVVIISNSRQFFFFFLRFYLFIPERQRERGRDIGSGRSRLPAGEPNVRLNPGILGPHPEPKADAQQLSHPDVPLPNI